MATRLDHGESDYPTEERREEDRQAGTEEQKGGERGERKECADELLGEVVGSVVNNGASDTHSSRIRDKDGLTILSLVTLFYRPLKELWGLNKELDVLVPRGIMVNPLAPKRIVKRILEQEGRKAIGEHYFPILKATLGSTAEKVRNAKERDWAICDPLVQQALAVLPLKLEELRLGRYYSRSMEFAPNRTIKRLIFGENFNNQIFVFPPGLMELDLGQQFNQQLNDLPATLHRLKLGKRFQQMLVLPDSLQVLAYDRDSRFNRRFESLPDSLCEISFGYHYNQPLPNLPSNLKILRFADSHVVGATHIRMRPSRFNRCLSLPDKLQELTLGSSFNNPIKIPPSVTKLQFGRDFNQPVVLPVTGRLQELSLGWSFNKPIILPAQLKKVQFGYAYDLPIDLPAALMEVSFGLHFNQTITHLPASLKKLVFGEGFNQPLEEDQLPVGLEDLTFGEDFQHAVTLPEGLKKVVFDRDYGQPVTLPKGTTRVECWHGRELTYEKEGKKEENVMIDEMMNEGEEKQGGREQSQERDVRGEQQV